MDIPPALRLNRKCRIRVGWIFRGYDGGPPLPYPGYLHSFEFTIKDTCQVGLVHSAPPVIIGGYVQWDAVAHVDVSLYVILDSEGNSLLDDGLGIG